MPKLRNTSPRRIAGLGLVSVALLFAATACGGSDDAGTGDGGGGNTAFAAYTDCLKENGVTITMPSGGPRTRPSGAPGGFPSGMPRPSGSAGPGGAGFPGGGGFGRPSGVDDATWEKAQSACASLRPSGGPGNRPGGGNRGGMSAAYRTCLSDHGVTLDRSAPATSDPAVAKAVEACRALAPSAPPAG
ncbi:hypothetical protein ACFQFC_00410 [Amorphoplanes digitatis]|uniref:Uncharacterized protein n=1 Tax=Actinoplanes digitatis TaxID=1868 RepID=A0A7W7MQ02_9ACTN|nr:hypothetical protein [Actinoplanes digitatis]MBB4762638.1 hypothetical protein [Actinoplanes digitatis]GID91862.1 hypothetical protein Adi01nite_12740 [Actinoplanes digitatis]